MSISAFAVTGFAAWTIFLLVLVVVMRTITTAATGKPLNAYSPGGEDLSPLGQRITRAHLNCAENLPIFAAVILGAAASDQLGVTDGLAMWVLYARIAQSVVHVISTAPVMVTIRGTLLLVQLGLQGWMIYQLLT